MVSFYSVEWAESATEIPELVALQNAENPQVEVFLVSLDGPETGTDSLARFLHPMGVDFRTFVSDRKGQGLIDSMVANWTGVTPANLFYDSNSKSGATPPQMMGLYESFEVEMLINQSRKHEVIQSEK